MVAAALEWQCAGAAVAADWRSAAAVGVDWCSAAAVGQE